MPSHVHIAASAPMPNQPTATPLDAPFFSISSAAVAKTALDPSCTYGFRNHLRNSAIPHLRKIREALQNRIVARRFEQRQQSLHQRVDDARSMPHVQIERRELAAQME